MLASLLNENCGIFIRTTGLGSGRSAVERKGMSSTSSTVFRSSYKAASVAWLYGSALSAHEWAVDKLILHSFIINQRVLEC